jgi:tRNA nucleotidyltransferase (CCA-adding enzyme)
MTIMQESSRAAYTCLSELGENHNNGNTNGNHNHNLEEASASSSCAAAVVKDAVIDLLPEEQSLFQLFEDAAIAFEQRKPPFEIIMDHANTSMSTSMNMSTDESISSQSQSQSYVYKNADLNEFNLPKNFNHNINNNNNNINNNKTPNSKEHAIEIRIAGGWVRDKIMKQSSHDVDVALDSLSGHQFAIIVQQYLFHKEQLQHQDQHQDQDQDQEKGDQQEDKINNNPSKSLSSKQTKQKKRPRITVIAANPSQSKHLETATMTIQGIDCDFVHLRGGEVYTTNSRIPTLQQNATPLDDALRRDFTVNSLFYNLRQKQVEDWTGRGMVDLLQDRLLVTPIDARITFRDDPLRVLRAIRFAVRYDLTLSEEIVQAAMSPKVHESLHCKVSRERVGKELGGMLMGKNARPAVALRLMTRLKLAGCVFEFPRGDSGAGQFQGVEVKGRLHGVDYGSSSMVSEEDRVRARERGWVEATELLNFCSPILSSFQKDGIDIRIFYLSIFLHPFRHLTCTDAKGKEFQLPTFIVRDSIKYSNKDVSSVTAVLNCVGDMRSLLTSFEEENPSSSFCRLKAGMLIRSLKDLWPTAFVVAAIAEIHSNSNYNGDCKLQEHDTPTDTNTDLNNNEHVAHYVNKAVKLMQTIRNHDLDGCWKIRPLLDGKAILKSLDLPKGPLIGNYLQEQIKWMLLNPKGSSADCEVHLKSVRKRDLEQEFVAVHGTDVCMVDADAETSEKHCSKKAHIA